MGCEECDYDGTSWTVEVSRTYQGAIDATATVVVEDNTDYEEETIVKCPECGAWQDGISAEIHGDEAEAV